MEKKIDKIINAIPSGDRDVVFRKLWKAYVLEDLEAYAFAEDIHATHEELDSAAEAFVNGKYDCNLSYWVNIENALKNVRKY